MVFLGVFSTLCLQVGYRLGFWGGFNCSVSFIWCQLFAWLIRAAIFHLPPAFVVWSFFLCHRHLCTVSFFYGLFYCVGICVRLFVFALLVLASRYQCISQFLVSCCALAVRHLHPWRFELDFFPSQSPCGQPYKFHFEANSIWYCAIKFTKLHSAKCSLHKINVCDWGAASKSAHLNCTNLTHFHLTAGRFRGN